MNISENKTIRKWLDYYAAYNKTRDLLDDVVSLNDIPNAGLWELRDDLEDRVYNMDLDTAAVSELIGQPIEFDGNITYSDLMDMDLVNAFHNALEC